MRTTIEALAEKCHLLDFLDRFGEFDDFEQFVRLQIPDLQIT
jgi:hypothetical protein